jgi:hypothetical protein
MPYQAKNEFVSIQLIDVIRGFEQSFFKVVSLRKSFVKSLCHWCLGGRGKAPQRH